ncbi:MAG: DegT/DnrJ/EryC1/StrS family aminotransferase [Bacillota bacterium]
MNISHSYPGYDESVVEAAYESLKIAGFSGLAMKDKAENCLATFVGADWVLLTGSGYAAVQTALVAADVKPGQQIAIPTVTCPSLFHAIRSIGAIPLVVDVCRQQPLISSQIIDGLEFNGIVIIPQMFGIKQQLKPFAKNGRVIIEDAAQAFAPETDEFADITVFSFSPTKLITIGYGGAIATQSQELHDRGRLFLDPDHSAHVDNDNENVDFRLHSPVSDFQSAMLIAQLKRYHKAVAYRWKIVSYYDYYLNNSHRLKPQVPFRYQLILPQANSRNVSGALRTKGINAWSLGSQLIHEVFNIKGDFSEAEKWRNKILSLPLHEGLNENHVAQICKVVNNYL